MEAPYDFDHQGIKVTLVGRIINKSTDTYYGAPTSYLRQNIDFIQISREVEIPGRTETGSYDYAFSFKNLDLEIESHIGISIDVQYSVNAVMPYAGSMMMYTATASECFAVSNSNLLPPIIN